MKKRSPEEGFFGGQAVLYGGDWTFTIHMSSHWSHIGRGDDDYSDEHQSWFYGPLCDKLRSIDIPGELL